MFEQVVNLNLSLSALSLYRFLPYSANSVNNTIVADRYYCSVLFLQNDPHLCLCARLMQLLFISRLLSCRTVMNKLCRFLYPCVPEEANVTYCWYIVWISEIIYQYLHYLYLRLMLSQRFSHSALLLMLVNPSNVQGILIWHLYLICEVDCSRSVVSQL